MNIKQKGLVIVVLIAAWVIVIGCGIGLPKLPGLPGSSASMPWADVPAFPGSTQDMKESMATSLFNQAQASEKSKMETVLFYTDKKTSDVAAFYNDEMMKKAGNWGPDFSSSTGCTQDKLEGEPRAICSFIKKDADGREYTLSIDARKNPKGTNTQLIFVRTVGSLITK